MHSRCHFRRRVWLLQLLVGAVATPLHLAQAVELPLQLAAESAPALAVIYPDIPEPFRSVFLQIADGVSDGAPQKVHVIPVGPKMDAGSLNSELRRLNVKSVIALGRQGLKTAEQLDRDIATTVGGILSLPDSQQQTLTGISLTPDPALLFANMKSLQGQVKRVWVVVDPKHNDWLMRLAKEPARSQGLELLVQEASELSQAVRLYEQLFQGADAKRDAIWLPHDPTTLDEQTILPLVLRQSWQRDIPVFSSTYAHVKKGVLFVLYPNNRAMGKSLAAMALRPADARKGLALLRDVSVAVNLRTASHLGLNITSEQQRSFEAVFP